MRLLGLALSIILPVVCAQNAPNGVQTSVEKTIQVWEGVGNTFSSLVSSSSPKPYAGPCLSEAANEALINLDNLYKLGCQLNPDDQTLNPSLRLILPTLIATCGSTEPPISNCNDPTWSLRSGFLVKASFKVLINGLLLLYPVEYLSIGGYVDIKKEIQKWIGDATWQIVIKTYTPQEVSDILNGVTTNVTSTSIFLDDLTDDLAAVSVNTSAVVYSTSMEANRAYAPAVRDSPHIKFLQNIKDTIAVITNLLLAQRSAQVTFIHDDINKLRFLVRELKDIYFTTLRVESPDEAKNLMASHSKQAKGPQTFVLVLQPTTRKEITKALLEAEDDCGIYTDYLNTNASLITFALSPTYSAQTPLPFVIGRRRDAALYVDGLTYITQEATVLPDDYILSRVSFTAARPTANPVTSVAIFDCAQNTQTGEGSWQLGRNPALQLAKTNTTLVGRTLNVGVLNYVPFYSNGVGFSVDVMQGYDFLMKVNSNLKIYERKPGRPYYEPLLEAIENQEIDLAFTLVPLGSIDLDTVSASPATTSVGFSVVRHVIDRPADFLLILRPLSMPVWLASVVLATIFTAILMAYGYFSPTLLRHIAEGEHSSKKDLFEIAALGVASTFSVTKLQIIPTTLSSRLFSIIMWMFAYLLLVLYSSAMMTILLRVKEPIKSDQEAAKIISEISADTLIVIKDGIAYDTITTAFKNASRTFTTVDSIEAAYDTLMKNKAAVLVTSSIEASYIDVMSCDLEMIPYSALYPVLLTFPYSKTWSFASAIEKSFSLLSNSGVIDDAREIFFGTGRCYKPSYKIPSPSVLNIGDNASSYIFLLIGICVSFMVMGIEVLVSRVFKKKQSETLTELIRGRHYTAKIVDIKPSGIRVSIGNRPENFFVPNRQLHRNPLKVYNAVDMGLLEGMEIELTYFGETSEGQPPQFCRYYPEED